MHFQVQIMNFLLIFRKIDKKYKKGLLFLYIHSIMVLPEYQGKNIGTGIMNKLLQQIEEYKKVY